VRVASWLLVKQTIPAGESVQAHLPLKILDLRLVILGLSQTALDSGNRSLGVDQPDLDLLVNAVGYLSGAAAGGASCAPARLSGLGLELGNRRPGGFDIRMVFGEFQQEPVEIAAKFLKPLFNRVQPSGNHHLRAMINGQHRWHRGEVLLQRITLGDGISKIELKVGHGTSRLLEPIAVVIALSRTLKDIRELLRQLSAPLLGGPQLISIRGDLAVEETLRAIHISPAAAGHLFGEDRQ